MAQAFESNAWTPSLWPQVEGQGEGGKEKGRAYDPDRDVGTGCGREATIALASRS